MFVTFTSTVVILLMYALFLKLTVVSFANFRWISNLLPSKSGYMVVRMNFIGCRHRRVLRGTGFCLLFARHFPPGVLSVQWYDTVDSKNFALVRLFLSSCFFFRHWSRSRVKGYGGVQRLMSLSSLSRSRVPKVHFSFTEISQN